MDNKRQINQEDELLDIQTDMDTVCTLMQIVNENYFQYSRGQVHKDPLTQKQFAASYDALEALLRTIGEKTDRISKELARLSRTSVENS